MLKYILLVGAKSSPREYKYVDIREIPNVAQFEYDTNGEFVPPIEFSAGDNKQLHRTGSNDWGIKLKLLTTTTGVQQIISNLNDSNGTSSYSFTINNSYQLSCQVYFDMNFHQYGRYRMFFGIGSQKLPTNVWHDLEFRITNSVASCTLNGTQFAETYNLPSATDYPATMHTNPFFLGRALAGYPENPIYVFHGKFKDIQMLVLDDD